jgi:hypothetical protein
LCCTSQHYAQFERVLRAHVGAGNGHVIKACVNAMHACLVEFVYLPSCGLFGSVVVPVFIGK